MMRSVICQKCLSVPTINTERGPMLAEMNTDVGIKDFGLLFDGSLKKKLQRRTKDIPPTRHLRMNFPTSPRQFHSEDILHN